MDVLRSGKEAAAASVNAARNKNTLVKIPVGFMIKSSLKYNKNWNQSELGKKVSNNLGLVFWEKREKALE